MIRRFFRLAPAERLVVLEALIALPLAWAAVRMATPPRLVRLLTAMRVRAPQPEPIESHRITQLVTAVAANLPMRCLCLEQSLAAAWMLRRRGGAAPIGLGVAGTRGAFDAHAWVEVDGRSVVSPRYVPLQRFAS